jgi:hypothetical protein
MATFIDGVNRLLRINNIIKGDDDNITTFSDSQHAADINQAQIAIQDELAEIVSERLIPYEKTSSTITLETGTRTYALESNFIRFYGVASFYDSTQNVRLYEYPGGESALRDQDYQYATGTSTPVWWYWEDTTSKKVAFYAVPDANYNGRSLSYDYEKSVMVSDSTDTIPFHNTEEYYAFVSMAARRFRFMITNQDLGLLTADATYNNAKSRLYAFLRPTNANGKYGRSYG